MRSHRMAFFLGLFLALTGFVPVRAADQNIGAPETEESPGRSAEAAAKIEAIRRRIAELTERHARDLIAEQRTRGEKADAALVVGVMYEMGIEGDADLTLAAGYYRQAAELGAAEAECALGNLYSTGAEGATGRIERDPVKARGHYERAAAAGSAPAMFRLGELYSAGGEGKGDSAKALAYFVDAAKRGDESALERLAPVMKQARDWEAARPGRKANFPTSNEALVDPALLKAAKARNDQLNRFASHIYVELNRRIGASAKDPGKP